MPFQRLASLGLCFYFIWGLAHREIMGWQEEWVTLYTFVFIFIKDTMRKTKFSKKPPALVVPALGAILELPKLGKSRPEVPAAVAAAAPEVLEL